MDINGISDVLKEHIYEGNIEALRRDLIMAINIDENFTKGYFNNCIKYIYDNISPEKKDKIFEEFNGMSRISKNEIENLSQDELERKFVEAICKLEDNFCKDRVEDVKMIGKKMYPENTQVKLENEQSKLKEFVVTATEKVIEVYEIVSEKVIEVGKKVYKKVCEIKSKSK